MKRVRFVCAQPAIKYYAWQVEVMINNFIEMGVNPNQIDIVSKIENGVVPDEWNKLRHGYAARFFFYSDQRTSTSYISSIRPNILKQHWAANSYLERETIFYHDCDILFTKPVYDWITNQMIHDDFWYGSDTRWYIAYSYIVSKGQDVLDKMCELVGISEALVQQNELNSIGAQYLMKNVDYEFWNSCERDCENLFANITKLNNQKKAADPNYHELQIWCADMWALLWNAWKRGVNTVCHKNFEFSWATSNAEEFHQLNIFHNAGITTNQNRQFFKADYMNSLPYNLNLDIDINSASKKYYDFVQKVGKVSKL